MPQFDGALVIRVMRASVESPAPPRTDLNDFPMPFRITVDQAGNSIRKGFARKKAEIHFPKRFTSMVKFFSSLPRPIWRKIAEQLVK